jgi:hypothetical protein
VYACVPTLMALSEPPNSHTKSSEGRSAAWAFESSGWGRCEKKTTSISLTRLCESIAMTVGIASRRIVR